MPLTDEQLKTILLQLNYLTPEDAEAAQTEADERKVSFKQGLLELELMTSSLFENAIAEYYQLPYFDAENAEVEAAAVESLPEGIARRYGCVVVERADVSTVTVAISDPGNSTLEQAIRMNLDHEQAILPEEYEGEDAKKLPDDRIPFGGQINWVYATMGTIEGLFTHYRRPLDTRFQAIINSQQKVAPEILQEIFNDAIEMNASDIHFEPQEKLVMIRFRVDGVLHEAGRIPKEYYEGVLNRIKIAGNMHIDSHFKAQDGAIRYKSPSGTKVDMRVSIVPLVDGEKVVMRLLSEYVRKLTLITLGFSEENVRKLDYAANKPFGMILTCGPTGSGKSTTLYALLKIRNKPDVNISTVEDPVEYKIPGINHIQKNDETDLTFANGLRALMRQDPDIILVGEIRDEETAEIAVNAALTGHLLFSTLHANTAGTAVPRLLEMGVEPFLLASTLEVVIGQRLLRRICPSCRYSYPVSSEELAQQYPLAKAYFPPGETFRMYRGKGCESCGHKGYGGRTGIHELLVISPEVEEMIVARRSSHDITVRARKQGMKLMFEDGWEKVQQGITTMEELMRVASPPDEIVAVEDPLQTEEEKAAAKEDAPEEGLEEVEAESVITEKDEEGNEADSIIEDAPEETEQIEEENTEDVEQEEELPNDQCDQDEDNNEAAEEANELIDLDTSSPDEESNA